MGHMGYNSLASQLLHEKSGILVNYNTFVMSGQSKTCCESLYIILAILLKAVEIITLLRHPL
jgi:hypothetical protein